MMYLQVRNYIANDVVLLNKVHRFAKCCLELYYAYMHGIGFYVIRIIEYREWEDGLGREQRRNIRVGSGKRKEFGRGERRREVGRRERDGHGRGAEKKMG